MTVDAVIWDIGNVLLDWQPERFYDAAVGRARREALFAQVDLYGMNRQVDLGAPWQATVAALAARHPDFAPEIMMWHDNWLDMVRPEIPGSVRLLRALSARGVPVFALTNFGVESFALAERHFDFLALFDRCCVSGRLGIMKPDPRIYARLEAECGLPPDRLLFTDDRAGNIAAAAARGWQTHLFDGPEGWAARLFADGLLPEEVSA